VASAPLDLPLGLPPRPPPIELPEGLPSCSDLMPAL
jgi:hypothetical protein